MNVSKPLLPLLLLLPLLGGCVGGTSGGTQAVKGRDFNIQYLAKTDVDLVTETHQQFALEGLRELAYKLYRRNPSQLRRGRFETPEQAIQALFDPRRTVPFEALQGRTSIDAIRLAFDGAYRGDRVLAYIEGLRSMILLSYDNKTNFFLLDQLDPQRLYHSARNIEVAAWLLYNGRDAHRQLYLISNEYLGPVRNISFERLFGKLAAIQDNMARIVADSTNRQIKNVLQTVASMVFLPI